MNLLHGAVYRVPVALRRSAFVFVDSLVLARRSLGTPVHSEVCNRMCYLAEHLFF